MKVTTMLIEVIYRMKRILPGRYIIRATDLQDDSCVMGTAESISDILDDTHKRIVLEMKGASASKRIRLIHAANIAVGRRTEEARQKLKDRIIVNYEKIPSVAPIYKSVVFSGREANRRILKKYKLDATDSKEEG